MRGCEIVHVVDFPVRGAPAIEQRAIPGSYSLLDIPIRRGSLGWHGRRRLNGSARLRNASGSLGLVGAVGATGGKNQTEDDRQKE